MVPSRALPISEAQTPRSALHVSAIISSSSPLRRATLGVNYPVTGLSCGIVDGWCPGIPPCRSSRSCRPDLYGLRTSLLLCADRLGAMARQRNGCEAVCSGLLLFRMRRKSKPVLVRRRSSHPSRPQSAELTEWAISARCVRVDGCFSGQGFSSKCPSLVGGHGTRKKNAKSSRIRFPIRLCGVRHGWFSAKAGKFRERRSVTNNRTGLDGDDPKERKEKIKGKKKKKTTTR